ncbi:hypothetical protein O3W51_17305 [Streptomyces sp. H39-C1]|nr:hypothetical protein [Streptomyces sp. H39-C1]
MTRTRLAPVDGVYGDIEDEDKRRGPERDETDMFHQLIRDLVADGNSRAASAGRRARRTLDEMAPGTTVPALLVLGRSAAANANDACVLCGFWTCQCLVASDVLNADRGSTSGQPSSRPARQRRAAVAARRSGGER